MENKDKMGQLLRQVIDKGASDLHLVVGVPPCIRKDGELIFLREEQVINPQMCQELIFTLLDQERQNILVNNKELDFSLDYGNMGRFRVNIYYQKGSLAASFRYIPPVIKSIEELELPKICYDFARLRQGFVLISGPTGHGKSTTIAAILNEILKSRSCNLITIEDPVEFVFNATKSLVSQRELNSDTYSWSSALRSVLREDPDVVLIGEMRDYETISAALTLAETGHLVFSTLHTNSASQTIDRIIDAFPEEAKNQVKVQLAATLEAVLSQRLIPRVNGGRIMATEIMVGSPAVRTAVREGRTHMLDNIIQTSGFLGMCTLDSSLAKLVKDGSISMETAKLWSIRPEEITRLLKRTF